MSDTQIKDMSEENYLRTLFLNADDSDWDESSDSDDDSDSSDDDSDLDDDEDIGSEDE